MRELLIIDQFPAATLIVIRLDGATLSHVVDQAAGWSKEIRVGAGQLDNLFVILSNFIRAESFLFTLILHLAMLAADTMLKTIC